MTLKIKKKDSTAILNSLYGGVVPNRGIEYILVGRLDEAKQIMKDLDVVKEGSSVIKFFIGKFGSGKSFIQALTQQIAFNEKFVVAKADFSPERRLYGAEGKALSLYTELIKNMAISSSPEGNALPKIIEKFIGDQLNETAKEMNLPYPDLDSPSFVDAVRAAIYTNLNVLNENVGGNNFITIVMKYLDAFVLQDTFLKNACLKWLSGEYSTKSDARKDLNVRDIIDDSNYYEHIKLIARFVRLSGYSGLVVNLDEAINLYKITHAPTREKNYETILKMYNDTLQGSSEGLYITFGGTPEFLENERKGLFSYHALKSRLQTNKFENDDFRDMSQPVITLTPLKFDDLFVLLTKIRDIHSTHYGYPSNATDDELKTFIKNEYERPGAAENLTTRDVVRTFIGGLNILEQNPSFDRKKVFERKSETVTLDEKNPTDAEFKASEKQNINDRFSRFKRSNDKKSGDE